MNKSFSSLFFLLFFLSGLNTNGDTTKTVFRFDIMTEILPGTARMVSRAMENASTVNADVILIHMNTYGGMLDAADSIRTRLLNSSIPIIVFIDNNAASAGALISIACNKIYMRSGSSIGAATVVDMEAKALPDKYQSYMRSMMRATAEKRGRDPKIAEAMVDPRTYIPGINDSGKVLTFTTSEAIKNGYCDGQAESLTELLEKENLSQSKIIEYKPTWIDNIIGFFMNPAISGILILIMLGGIYFELQTPGIGFPIIAAVAAAILYFAPLYLEGLAENWEIVLVIAGFILLAVELLFFPGFGVAGIAGIICMISGFTLSLIPNEGFDFGFSASDHIMQSLTVVLSSMVVSLIFFFVFGRKVLMTKTFGRLILQDALSSGQGYVSAGDQPEIKRGEKAIAYSDLRPAGKVNLNGRFLNAVAEIGFIEKGKEVIITDVDGLKVTVREAES